MSSDAKWIIGTMGGLVIAVAGLLSAQIGVEIDAETRDVAAFDVEPA